MGALEVGRTRAVVTALVLTGGAGLRAQTADPAAASGMTSGLPGVSTARQAELMQVRARAQAARPEAEQAAMERTADDALARKSQQQLLDESREMKLMKEQAARQLEHQRAADAYRGVTAGEISSWADDSGRVKVERGVPAEVLASLPPEEEEEFEEEGGFNPFKSSKKAMQGAARAASGATDAVVGVAKKGVSWIPGLGKKDESAAEPTPTAMAPDLAGEGTDEKKGFMRGLTAKLPLIGDRGESTEPAVPVMSSAPSPFAEGGSIAPQTNPYAAPEPTPVSLMTSGGEGGVPAPANSEGEGNEGGFFKNIPFIGSKKAAEGPVADATAPQPADLTPTSGEKEGVLSGFKGFVGRMVPGGADRSSGPPAGSGPIDASLFPQEGDSEKLMADQSQGGDKKKFFNLPELSVPSFPSVPTPEPKQPMPKKTFAPASYVVQKDGAQFMRFGAGPLGSEAQSLRAGTSVIRTKVGDEWSTIQLADGSTGIIRNSDLKAGAEGGAVPVPAIPVGPVASGGFASASPGSPARITAPVSATGAGVSDVPGPPVRIPTSSLTSGGSIPPASTIVPPIP